MVDPDSTADLLFRSDLWLGVLFAAVLLLVVARITRKSPDRRVLLAAAAVKFVCALAFVLYSIYLFHGGDTFYYHGAGLEFSAAIRGGDAVETGCFDGRLSSTLFL